MCKFNSENSGDNAWKTNAPVDDALKPYAVILVDVVLST